MAEAQANIKQNAVTFKHTPNAIFVAFWLDFLFRERKKFTRCS